MFPKTRKYDYQRIGIWSFLVGAVCKVVGIIVPWLVLLGALRAGDTAENTTYVTWQVIGAFGDPLMYNGIVLYLLGRLLGAWSVSLIGFEHTKDDELWVRGPDGTQTVWIGRKYDSALKAEAAAAALRARHTGGEP